MRAILACAACFCAWCAQTLEFEVASVKPSSPPANGRVRGNMRGGPGTPDPGQITFTNVTLANALLRAYNLNNYQLAAPGWLSTERYDIAARIPAGTSKEQFEGMLQRLLVERFRIVLHHESREFQGYELAEGRGGPKLKPSAATAGSNGGAPEPETAPQTDAGGFPILDRPGLVIMEGLRGKAVISYLTAKAQPLSALVERLSKEFQMPIVDRTGLGGKFDFTLEFAPQPPGAVTPVSPDSLPAAPDESGPNLLNAVQQQLGLRLNARKIPVDVLVIDRAERIPAAN